MLAELRTVVLRFAIDGDRLLVEPKSALTDALRTVIRVNKPAILRELADDANKQALAPGHPLQHPELPQSQTGRVRDTTPLVNFREALVLGRLHVCCNCSAFSFGTVPAGIGHCRRFDVEAWPFVPFWCSGFEASSTPAAPEFLADRRSNRETGEARPTRSSS